MKLRYKALTLAVAATAVGAPFLSTPAQATPASHVHSQSVPFTFSLDLTIDCQNSPGSTVTFNGLTGTGSTDASIFYANNTNLTHSSPSFSATVDASIDPIGGSLSFPKQPSQPDGVTGNPWIWYDAGDGLGPQLIGHCISGSSNINKHVGGTRTITATVQDIVQATDCSKTNADATLSHNQTNPEVDGTLWFDNNKNKPSHTQSGDASVNVTMGPGASFRKDADLKAGMGNPLVFLYPGATNPSSDLQALVKSGDAINLGHCNQLL